ncbi:MAG: ABC transporter permease subunit [Anaerolineae bacterium]|nr:ABC transporter permease subunit [Anaerolineae bacterium]
MQVISRLWRGLVRLLIRNPVVFKELRGRMRGARAFTVLTVYLVLLGVFAVLIYVTVTESSTSVSGQAEVGEIGRTLFGGVVAIEMLLVAFIAPAFTAGAISGEREHQTFELLRTTLLPAHSLVLGKLLSSMLYVVLLLLAAIPLQSIAFFFGGVTEIELILTFVVLAATALLFSAIGAYFSARARRTLSASLLTYATAMFFMFGIPILVGVVMLLADFSLDDAGNTSTEIGLLYGTGAALSLNPAATAIITQYLLVNQRTTGLFSYTLTSGDDLTLISPWIPFTAMYVLLTLVFFILAVRRVRQYVE